MKPRAAELLSAVMAIGGKIGMPPAEEGWLSTRDIAGQLGLSMNGASNRLRKLLAQGKAECMKVSQSPGGNVNYWRLKHNGKP